ncbi:transposase [Oxalobacter sp. OttesenSCG-928-P03]|nr:transposase [Oxalobacter sp. OttesenSCG-928-P03]
MKITPAESLYILTDEQYALVEPILMEERDPRGRKPKISDRHALEGILYVLRMGCRWRQLPEDFGQWMMVFMRYKRWTERGTLWKVLMRLQKTGALRVSVISLQDERRPANKKWQ